MTFRITVLLLAFLAPLLSHHPAANAAGRSLTAQDETLLFHATDLAGHAGQRALEWLKRQGITARMTGQTIEMHFPDGAEAAILPRGVTPPSRQIRPPIFQPKHLTGQSGARALVLEPFADQLYPAGNAGEDVVQSLQQAGFQVTYDTDQQVTIDVMKTTANYNFVYMETHSNPLPDTGDVIIVVRQTDNQDYASYFSDGSIMQATVAGDPTKTLFLALKSAFFRQHVGTFLPSSMFFVNGCDILGSPLLWDTLQAQHLGTLLGWDGEVYSYREAAPLVFDDLLKGETVDQMVRDVQNAGPGISLGAGTIARLGYDGDGSNTLQRIHDAELPPTPTPMPTATETATPTATATPLPASTTHHKKHPCKAGRHRVKGKCVRIKCKKKHCA